MLDEIEELLDGLFNEAEDISDIILETLENLTLENIFKNDCYD